MPVSVRPSPAIPDHEVLRKIGGGAYGEVWLARGVTGAYRAVKVVWREDFEDDRGFEREFEGILRFEPISRDHPGLVNILHVGRGAGDAPFYYYVMELGDDARSGGEINPVEYEPRTLRSNYRQTPGQRWDTDECLDVGLRLAEALGHLHERGLAHRDVKPSNIIFVNGKAKLADIGLVAARGQRTFVGTEGFVPPEGPGSAQADIYSLGKVLYEMATGMDRMSFPELPEDMPTGPERRRWLQLNQLVCDVCEPRVSKRTITTAAELAAALRRIRAGKRSRRGAAVVWLAGAALMATAGWAGWQVIQDGSWLRQWRLTRTAQKDAVGMLRVFSTPEGADVLDDKGVWVGTTPTPTLTAHIGDELKFTLRKQGYREMEIRGKMTLAAVNEPLVLSAQLAVFAPPRAGETWIDQLGNSYLPVDDHHLGASYVTRAQWERFLNDELAAKPFAAEAEFLPFSQHGAAGELTLTSEAAAQAYCRWLEAGGLKAGFLTELNEVGPQIERGFEHPQMSDSARSRKLLPFRVMVRQIRFGGLVLTSEPPGAEVYLNGRLAGNTAEPLHISRLKPGPLELLLVLEGYRPLAKSLTLPEGEILRESLKLSRNQGVVFGRPWQNGIGMRFVPVGPDLMVSVWETRVSDYMLFASEMNHPRPPPPFFTQEPDHPIVNVSRDDATAFCVWLTERERRQERITRLHEYRLPTDREWSVMVGLAEEEGSSPSWRDARKQAVFPWGPYWSESEKHGNFADMSAARSAEMPAARTIPGYDDGFPYTSPVGEFPANSYGLFDLSGNAQEWVSDDYSRLGVEPLGVLRGGGWNTHQLENLYSGSRNAVPPSYRDSFYGFRIVLAKEPPLHE